MKLSLRTKLTVSFAIIIIGALLAIGMVTYSRAKAIVQNEIRYQNEQTVKDVDQYYLRNFMADMAFVVELWARDNQVTGYTKAPGQTKMVKDIPANFQSVYHEWDGYVKGNPDIAWLYLGLQNDGSAFFAPVDPTMPDSYDCRTRSWYQGAVANPRASYWTQPYLDAGESGELLVTVSRAVLKDRELVGVVAMDIKLRKFSELIRGLNSDNGGYLMMLGSDGAIYAHPDSRLLMKNITSERWISEVMQGRQGSGYFTRGGQEYLYSYLTVEKTGWKLISVSPVNVGAVLREVRSWTLDAAMLSIVGLLILGSFVTLLFLRPLTEMVETIRRVSDGDMEARMVVRTEDELGELGEEFNRMLNRIDILMKERDRHVSALMDSNMEISEQKMEITALYEETEAMNDTLSNLLTEIKESYLNTVQSLANAIEANDNYTRGHCDRVRFYAMQLADNLQFSEQDRNDLEFASMLHDIGKLGVPSEILNKPGSLTDAEFEAIKQHPVVGYEILAGVPFLESCRVILRQHHERIDGRGYPDGISGDDINYSSRILAIVDAYDAMTTSRPYRNNPLTVPAALAELERSAGTQFDSELTRIFVELIRKEDLAEKSC